MIIDIQKGQSYFESGDILHIRDGEVVMNIFEAREADATPVRCEFCHFADCKENCYLQSFCYDTRFLDITQ